MSNYGLKRTVVHHSIWGDITCIQRLFEPRNLGKWVLEELIRPEALRKKVYYNNPHGATDNSWGVKVESVPLQQPKKVR